MTTTPMPRLEARVRLHKDETKRNVKLLAFAELTIGQAFVIRGIRVLQNTDEPDEPAYIVFPAERGKGDDRWYDVAHPSTVAARLAATKLILEEYARVEFNTCKCGQQKAQHGASRPSCMEKPR